MIIKVTDSRLGFGRQVVVYGILQNKITNYLMATFIGETAASMFSDKPGTEIGVEEKILKEL